MARRKCRLKAMVNEADPDLPPLHRHSVVHYQQRTDWDCGISCVMMMLTRRQRQDFLRNFNRVCEEEGFGNSTWTIDLCYLLRRFDIRHIYTTITVGVNPTFRNHDYYGPILWKDHIRHLAENGPVIVLTNGYLLHCDLCKTKESECLEEFRKCFSINKPKTKFSGHYIVLCGYDNRIGSVFYRNPAMDDHVCVMSYRKLTEARTANGTDEDLIFVFRKS
ncbi:protein GUCD1-like isoform X2 [Sitodiplosis mosellana]|uniref:protein GUCD1-like isoform X2 n=1 Tax=Sitodiplosis mosellana TaxID=263140 RepID=UPI002443B86D|nr:protein GUCD1-like isoform X2 [Sitodiplosis mosellana]